jgi:ABC-type transport system substrate-binding protein
VVCYGKIFHKLFKCDFCYYVLQIERGEKNMNKTLRALMVATILVAFFMSIAPVFAGLDDYPRHDEMYSVICSTESVTVAKALAGEIDTAWDVRSSANVNTLKAAGWYCSAVLGFGFHYVGINSRNVAPSYIVPSYDYHGRRAGDPLFPLNISEFRFALHLIIGGEVKERIIKEVFDWTSVKIDTCPTPAAGEAWIAPISSVHDETAALELLNSIGFYNTTGIWVNTNPAIGPVGEIRSTAPGDFNKVIRVLGCPEAATSTSLVSKKFMDEWNRFFGKNSAGQDYFQYDDIPWASMQKIFAWDHSADLWGAGWVVGRDPDYLYTFFHTSGDIFQGYNHPGISDPTLDRIVEQLKYTLNYTTMTMITDITQLQALCKEAQWRIYYLSPYIVNRAAITPNLFAAGVTGFIEPLGYTASTGWNWDWTYKPGASIIRMCNPGTIGTLNPLTAGSVYEWNILNRIYDGFIAIDPFTKDDKMWAIKSYTMVEWKDTAQNIWGFNVTFNLRRGIKWHDGDPFTADDAIFSWNFLASVKSGRYQDFWEWYISSEKIDDYTVKVSFNNTGFWYLYDIAGTAMMFRESVWSPFFGNKAAAEAFEPWKVKYDTHTGQTGHGDLTCLVGTGTWVFVLYHEVGLYARFMANRPFSITGQFGGTWNYTGRYWAPFLREDTDWSGKVEMIDLWNVQRCFGAIPGHPRWDYGRFDIVKNWKVDMVDLWSVQKKFGKITLPA